MAAVLRKCIDGADDAQDEFEALTSRKKVARAALADVKTKTDALQSVNAFDPGGRRKGGCYPDERNSTRAGFSGREGRPPAWNEAAVVMARRCPHAADRRSSSFLVPRYSR